MEEPFGIMVDLKALLLLVHSGHLFGKMATFDSGYMSGAIWQDGTWNYGTAENIYWGGGLWRNGNWNRHTI
jgi:hypothetical protein